MWWGVLGVFVVCAYNKASTFSNPVGSKRVFSLIQFCFAVFKPFTLNRVSKVFQSVVSLPSLSCLVVRKNLLAM